MIWRERRLALAREERSWYNIYEMAIWEMAVW